MGSAGAISGTVFYGYVPTPATNRPVITKVKYKAAKKEITVNGDNFDETCTLLINGDQVEINPTAKKNKVGQIIRLRRFEMTPGTYLIQIANGEGAILERFVFSF